MFKRWAASTASLWWPVLTVGGVILVLALIATNRYEISLLTSACINLIVLAGLNVIAGYGGQLALGQAAFVGTGAYATTIIVMDFGWPPLLALLVSPIVAAAFALLIGLPSLRLRGLYFAVATLAFGLIFHQMIVQGATVTGGPDGRGGLPPLESFGINFSESGTFLVLASILAMFALAFVRALARTWFGWGLRASRVSEPASSGVGVPVFGSRLSAFVISGVLGGLGGSLLAFQHSYVSPSSFTFFASIDFFMVLFIGGLGTFLGPVAGTVILYVFARWGTAFPDAQPFILGIVFLIALRFFPLGIGGNIESLWRKARSRHASRTGDTPNQDEAPAEGELSQKESVAP